MTELLGEHKRRLLAEPEHGDVTLREFDEAWAASWEVMVLEHAWPHATAHRRGWRSAMLATRSEARAAWLGQPTPFALAVERLSDAAGAPLGPDRVPKVLLSLFEFTALPDDVARSSF
jgi:hypothetical protein